MKLQTQIPLQPQQYNQIDYNSRLLLFGSCFSENIGNKFTYHKFQTVVNPFGILFHPLAIENLITRAINKDYYTEEDLQFYNEQWFCLDAHSKLNQTSKEELLKVLNSQLDKTCNDLLNATHIVITLGTSWVYRHIESDKIVANCHKLPQKQFLKELLSVDQISESLEGIISLVKSINPKVSFLFTVSPVRHTKDGFVENTLSKSHLITAINQVVEPRQHLYYFPSYEIMMDELRDYRFYNADMIHPNQLAIDYIWEKFKTVWLSDEALKTSKIISTIQAKKAHRPFNPNSEAHLVFLQKLQVDIEDLQHEYPFFNFE
ncbi:GSCFA domain-containing protein [Winogradskyella undariae]|uniref:GSCFA domain-containing protein n=1 Tax=Winogradskyella TaxID=286104 RepID=UPI00156ADBF0|nr:MULTISPECIES: GSCFA domain-containing protein [Winogradskyella]NRR91762.1 GSCFA domain-containing protein [Winogradskyella undariae]QXP77972.1 GSCFA domain-containing protein [Winogradskyella sp. HaHa_3_26]